MNEKPTSSHIGQPVRRREDLRLVTGNGSYADDVNLPGQVYAVMVRSPHAHARIGASTRVRRWRRRACSRAHRPRPPGRRIKADPHKVWSQHPAEVMLKGREGFKTFTAPHYPLPTDKVRFVGEAVAMVVAHTVAAAKDAAELVEIDYEALPAVTDTREAATPMRRYCSKSWGQISSSTASSATPPAPRPRSPAPPTRQVRHLGAKDHRRSHGAARRGATFDPDTGRTTLYAGSGGVWRLKDDLATILAGPEGRGARHHA